jgi:SAM-dependent methyltransferase
MSSISETTFSKLKLDLGCGSLKKTGTVGVDIDQFPGVDYVVDLQINPLPFPDHSVEYIHSSHFFEHLDDPGKVLVEVGRVCKDGAKLEFWTPYAWSNPAFVFGHKFFFTEEIYMHLCIKFPDEWQKVLNSRWVLKEIVYIVSPITLLELQRANVSIDFALKHYVNIVEEFGVFIDVFHESTEEISQPIRSIALARDSEHYPIDGETKVSYGRFTQSSLSSKVIKAKAIYREEGIGQLLSVLLKKINRSKF